MHGLAIPGRVFAHEGAAAAVVVIDGAIAMLDAVESEDGVLLRVVVPLNRADALALSLLLVEAAEALR